MPSPNLDQITTTTLRNRTGRLADNVLKNNALLKKLSSKGKVKLVSGGRSIVQELEYAESATFRRYSGYELLNIAASDVFTAADFNYAQAVVAVTISGLEMLQNSGKEAIIDLLDARIGNAERTLMNNISTDCYSDGTADSGKQIGGLQSLVADLPTSGTVGGIDRATWPFWQNQYYRGVTDGGAAVSASNITKYMNLLYLRCSRGVDRPDLIIADNNYFNFYWQSLQAIQRLEDPTSGSAGFLKLKYLDADVCFDGGYQGTSGGSPANHLYMLNSNYIHFRPHRDRNMVPLDSDRYATNQDAMVKLIGFAGNMTISNAFVQGVLVA